jgi:8-oxo-dGTP diphosphatase
MRLHAVKALIYRPNGSILLQQRDDKPDLPFAGRWTFFGGQVEPGENLVDALRRELLEELGCLPGLVGDELFRWNWHGVQPAHNHFFSVRCDVSDEALVLNEGQAMGWFSLDELTGLSTTPVITDNMFHIARFLNTTARRPQQESHENQYDG